MPFRYLGEAPAALYQPGRPQDVDYQHAYQTKVLANRRDDPTVGLYYDAGTGQMIWQHRTSLPAADAGRGMVADIDPRFPGMETWSFNGEVNYTSTPNGLYNASTNQLVEPDTTKQPWPHMGVWWDGDLLRELFSNEPTPANRDAGIVKWTRSTRPTRGQCLVR